jgi:hypothetical protein
MPRKLATRKRKTARKAATPARRVHPKKPDPFEALAAASEAALGLPIKAAWRAGVRVNLKLLFQHAARVDAFELPDETEPAPVFRA